MSKRAVQEQTNKSFLILRRYIRKNAATGLAPQVKVEVNFGAGESVF